MTEQNSAHIFNVLLYYGDIGMMEAAVKKEEVASVSQLDKAGELYFYYDVTVLLDSCDDIETTIATARQWQEKYESDHIRVRRKVW